MQKKKSWSGIVEAISRCVAAFQAATDATEHSQCQDIVTKLYTHATALTRKTETSPYIREIFGTLLYQYTENRTYNLAFKKLLDLSFGPVDPFWTEVGEGQQRDKVITIIFLCTNKIKDKAQQLQNEMMMYRCEERNNQ